MAIRSHEYKTSKKQFNKLYSKYKSARLTLISRLEKAGYSKISSAEFMYGEGSSNFLRDQYHVFREKGFSSQDAKREISRQYFGSK